MSFLLPPRPLLFRTEVEKRGMVADVQGPDPALAPALFFQRGDFAGVYVKKIFVYTLYTPSLSYLHLMYTRYTCIYSHIYNHIYT